MDLESLSEFIRTQKEALAREKLELGLDQQFNSHRENESPKDSQPTDRRVPSLTNSLHLPALNLPRIDDNDPQQLPETKKEEKEEKKTPKMLRYHQPHLNNPTMMVERRAVTAGDQPQSVSESFYNYFPSLNTKKQQVLQERRKEYFDYLKKSSPTAAAAVAAPASVRARELLEYTENPDSDLDERRKLEKDRLATQFQTSKQRSILNYQIVEARNQRVAEEAQQKKQEYFDDLKKQIEDQKRRQEAQRQLERMADDIIDRKIALDALGPAPEVVHKPTHNRQSVPRQEQPVTQHNSDLRLENLRKPPKEEEKEEEKENRHSYNYFSNSAKESSRQVVVVEHKIVPATVPQHRPCCDSYKQILEKLETLCRWRDEFVAKKRVEERRNEKGCLLCESGSLKCCNFCGATVVGKGKGNRDRFEDSLTDSGSESSFQGDFRRPLPSNRQYKMITTSLADMSTPQVRVQEPRIIVKEEEEAIPVREFRNSSFLNFDDIPLPTQRKEPPPPARGRTRVAKADDSVVSSSRLRLNEMKKVEWKWDIPAVQKHEITRGQPERVLTQLGAIRKQLQMEQFKLDE